jgi:hypothetical protein
MSEERRTGTGYYVAAALLIVLLLTAIWLIVAMVMRPSIAPPEVIVITDRAAVSCPTAQKGSECYDTQVTNTGGSVGTFACRVDGTGDTQATFSDGLTVKQVTVGPNESVHVVSTVTAPGVSPTAAPHVLCTDVS